MLLPRYLMGTPKLWKILSAILLTTAWLFLWYFPWQAKLNNMPWLQLGIGLAIFIIPGSCVYGLLSDRLTLEFNHITYGFVISHLIFALLGIVGRFFHLSFDFITSIMMMLGLVLLLIYMFPKVGRGFNFQINRERPAGLLYTLPILLISILVSLIVIQRAVNSDDLTYLAYLTNLQHSAHLGFNDLIFGESQLLPPRFWLISAPFSQAFLAEFSGLPGLLILGGYYEPFLVIISVLCWYELAITLKLSPRAAGASVILHLLFLLLLSEYLHPGAPYIKQLSADKASAAFILAPVFFQSLTKRLEHPTQKNTFLLLLMGLSLTLMHPIILAYAVIIGGLLILQDNDHPGFRSRLIPIFILVIILIPQIAIRFVDAPVTKSISYEPEVILNQSGSDNLITRWRGTQYYGFNPSILGMNIPYGGNFPVLEPILTWGWILIPILSVIFAVKQRKNSVAQLILSSFILCFLTWFPLTGWIFGYFLNARMLARSVWLFPYGLSAVFVLLMLRDYIRSIKSVKSFAIKNLLFSPNLALATLTIISSGLFLLYMRENNLPDLEKFRGKLQRYQDLAVAGQALDQQITGQGFVIGSPNLNDLIPGLSSKSDLITFRTSNPSNMYYYTTEQRNERISDTQRIFARSASAEEKMELLKKYNVSFLFLTPFDLRLFEELMETFPNNVKQTEVGGVIILEINY